MKQPGTQPHVGAVAGNLCNADGDAAQSHSNRERSRARRR
jgi:hypothetical protein